jgi:hypothetical protein
VDSIQRDTMFAGLTDREVAEAVVREMRRRNLYGCVFLLSDNNTRAVFGSSTPKDTMRNATASQQLHFFAEVAAFSIGEKATLLGDGDDTSFDPKTFIN